MNILIADSGASKTDWVLLSEGSSQFVQTEGLNPHLTTAGNFLDVLTHELKPNLLGKQIGEIRFFGSGCGAPDKKKEVKAFLQEVFEFATIRVQTDLDAAGIALFGDRPGIVCILGTGSSAGFFEQGEVVQQMPSVGYPHGDEGSGSDLGKRIMMKYLKNEFSKDMRELLETSIPTSLEDVFKKVQTPRDAKLFLSEVSKHMGARSNHPLIQTIIYEGFSEFLDKVSKVFPDKTESCQLGFVGSVASVYEGELRACAKQKGIEIASVIRNPIEHIALQFGR